ncbi:MAG: 30S ribosomal protein S7 [Candidatus Peribacteraceae bacterium]|nr:30S ribosomal protein S7 [Candidatus Peribacteraceae bacterium]
MKRKFVNGIPFKGPLLPGSDPLQEKFINYVMLDGKKSIAREIFREMMEEIKKVEKKPDEIFAMAIENASPAMEVRPKRVGGAVYQVPIEVSPNRQRILAMRWILEAARSAKGRPIHQKLASVILETAKGEGPAVKKKEDAHRMAAANKAFAHFAKY